jgi:hypothetical protein
MDKGLKDFLNEMGLSIKSSIATIAMGGEGPEVKLDRAIEDANIGGIRKNIEAGAISRKTDDLIHHNLRFLTNPEDPKRLQITKEILNCQDFLDSSTKFDSGYSLFGAISANSACQFQAIARHLEKNGKTGKGQLDNRLLHKITDVVKEGNQKMFDAIVNTKILEKSWIKPLIDESIKENKPEMFKKLINSSKDLSAYQSDSLLETAQKKYSESKNPDYLNFARAILQKCPKSDLKTMGENKDGQWLKAFTDIANSILHNTKHIGKVEKESLPSM